MNQLFLEKLNERNEHHFVIEDQREQYHGFPDICAIRDIIVDGTSQFIRGELYVDFTISCKVDMLTSDLCEDITVPLDFQLDLVFANNEKGDYPLDNVINIDDVIIANIIAECPYTITKHQD